MINPPWYNDSIEALAFNTYAMNVSELDELIMYFRNHPSLELNEHNIYNACLQLQLSFCTLSDDEYEYVMKGLNY